MIHEPRIIVALDVSSREQALDLARTLRPATDWVKIGLELFTSCGPGIVQEIKELGYNVFLDLKLMDIPNTVKKSVNNCMRMGVDMLTLHLLGGEKMITAALEARAGRDFKAHSSPVLLGVTLLTSLERPDLPWPESRSLHEVVMDLASRAEEMGAGRSCLLRWRSCRDQGKCAGKLLPGHTGNKVRRDHARSEKNGHTLHGRGLRGHTPGNRPPGNSIQGPSGLSDAHQA